MAERVLVVDDEPLLLSALQRVLRKQLHVQVEVADGVDSALASIEDGVEPAVVLTDLRMPVRSGLELLETIRRRWPDTARLLFTGYADLPGVSEAIEARTIHLVLHKPIEPWELESAIRWGLDHHRLSRQYRRCRALLRSRDARSE